MKKYFRFAEHNTNYRTEIIAGLTTFITISYIIIINPALLEYAGVPKDGAMMATILTAGVGTIFLGIYSNRPFAVAPYMVANIFVTYTVVEQLGYSWQTALGGIFIGGIIYTVLTLLKIRSWLAKAIPYSVKSSIGAGIGLFIAFIGLLDSGIITLGSSSAPVKLGDLSSPEIRISIFTLVFTGLLYMKKVPGSLLIGILISTLIGLVFGISTPPESLISMPPAIDSTFLKLDLAAALEPDFLAVIFTLFVIDFVGTLAVLIALGMTCGMADKEGNIKDAHKPMLADSLSTVFGSLFGTTTSGIFVESAAGIKAGGRTGFTAVVIGLCFAAAIFFTPMIFAIPSYAFAPILIILGATMLSPLKNIDYDNISELMPNAIIIFSMVYTMNIGIGITSGLILYPIFKLFAGKHKEITSGMWVFFVLSVLFFILKP